jgi:hypothetical protein
MAPAVDPATDLAGYVREQRFSTQLFQKIESEIWASWRGLTPKMLVVRGPYPPDREEEPKETDKDRPAPTHSCGKTDLLRMLAKRLENNTECHVFAFLDGRRQQAEESRFYQDAFFPRLADAFPQRLKSVGSRAMRVARAIWNRGSLLVSVAGPSLAGAAGAFLAPNVIDFLRNSKNRDLLTDLLAFFHGHPDIMTMFGFVLAVAWLAHAWGKVQNSKDAMARWDANKVLGDPEELESTGQERLAHDPRQLLEVVASDRKALVLLIDDLDCMDTKSVEQLLELYQAAREPARRLVMVLGYNPQNPVLLRDDRSFLRQEFEARELRRKHREEGWQIFELAPPGPSQVKAWLWGYYNDPRAEQIYDTLTATFSDTETSPSVLLSYFRALDEDRLPEESRAAPLARDSEDLKQAFEKHLGRDRHIAQSVLALVAGDANEKQCIEALKYTLAFREPRVRVERLAQVMAVTRPELEPRLDILSNRAGLLVRDGDSVTFAQGHLRALLQTAWPEWRSQKEQYATRILNACQRSKWRENADVALDAEASEYAIDVLWRTGEFQYNYYGATNAGYALRYYGLKSGALGKWRHLFQRMEEEAAIWSLLSWKSKARLTPFRLTSGKQYSPYTFIPELFVTTARLYWMIGDDETALEILGQWWPEVMEKLPAAGPAPKVQGFDLGQKVLEKNHEIEAAIGEILLRRGAPGDWDRAAEMAARHENAKPVRNTGGENLRIFGALIHHYRRFGVGNALYDLNFLQQDSSLEGLTRAADDAHTANLERCRATFALAESYRHMLRWPSLGVPTRISGDDIENSTLDEKILSQWDAALNEQQKTLDERARELKQSPATQPGTRLAEGSLLLWEAVYLSMRARQFCFEALRPRAVSPRPPTPEERFYETYETVRRLTDFCVRCLPAHRPPAGYGAKIELLDQIEGSLDRNDSSRLRQQEKEARELLAEICQTGAAGIATLAKERSRMAEAIFRRLGFRRGIREVIYVRAMLERDFSAGAKPAASHWAEDLENACATSPELGAHLDAVQSCLAEAAWAADHDLNRAGHAIRRGIAWAERVGLPSAQRAELASLLTQHLGNAENLPVPLPEIISVCETAGRLLDSLTGSGGYVSETLLTSRRLNIHWWLAELYRRNALGNTVERAASLKKARSEVDALIDKAKRRSGFVYEQHRAMVIRSRLLWEAGQAVQALEDMQTALKHFREVHSDTEALQTANYVVEYLAADSDDPRWATYRDDWREPFRTLESLASEMAAKRDGLGGVDQLVLARACMNIGGIYASSAQNETALSWYEKAFQAFVNVGLFGTAILLDTLMQPLYRDHSPADRRFEAQKERILAAAHRLDRAREQVDFAEIARILRGYTQVAIAATADLKDKQDLFHAGKAAMGGNQPDLPASIESLERAANLIVDGVSEDIDIEILEHLRSAYLRSGEAEKAEDAGRRLEQKRSLIESRDFLELAGYFEAAGGDYIWALDIAANVKIENSFSRRARERRSELLEDSQPSETGALRAVSGGWPSAQAG